jgi:cell wall-associated NlpC family hydrolase
MTHRSVAVPVSTLWSAPDAPREVDAPAISATPDISAWYEAMNTEDRLDCSGLVHLAFRGHGWVVPRDAHDQQAAATEVAPARARPGDLYFFGTTGEVSHVGLFSGDDQMLHAPQTGELVEEESLVPDRLRGLTRVGRFGSGGGAQMVKTR